MPNPENLLPFQFKKGESGNPNGRPRKMVKEVVQALKDEGLRGVSRVDIVSSIEHLLNLTEDEIKALGKDKSQSILIRTLCNHIAKGTKDEKVLTMILDRAFGKPSQEIVGSSNVTHRWEDPVEISDEKKAELAMLEKEFGKKPDEDTEE